MAKKLEKIRITIKGYTHKSTDLAASLIISKGNEIKVKIKGPIPIPTRREVITVIRSPHKHKDSREQFEKRTYKRILEVIDPTPQVIDILSNIQLSSGVEVSLKTI